MIVWLINFTVGFLITALWFHLYKLRASTIEYVFIVLLGALATATLFVLGLAAQFVAYVYG